jgi:hypothetical protein
MNQAFVALVLCLAGAVSARADGGELFTLVVGGTGSPFPPMLRPPGDNGLSGAQTIGGHFEREGITTIDRGAAVSVITRYREGDWTLDVEAARSRTIGRVDRRFTIGYHGPGEMLLRRMEVTLPVIEMQPDDLVELPVSPVRSSLEAALFRDRTVGVPGDGPRLVGVWSPKRKHSRLFWAYSEDEFPSVRVSGEGAGLRIAYAVPIAARMRSGSLVSWSGDHSWELDEPWIGALARFQEWWREAGVEVPRDRPRWAERVLLYETQIGAAVFDRDKYEFNPYPTMESLIARLDYIKGLGFTGLQIMPAHPSPSYAVDDYFDAGRQFGGAASLKRLVQEAHRRGMRVILDWLVHGVMDQEIARKVSGMVDSVADEGYKHRGLPDYVLNFAPHWIRHAPAVSPVRAQHPEWFMQFEDGSMGHIYTWAFDLENRQLQDYIIEAMAYYVHEYDVDGFRVDAPTWNGFANWTRAITYRPSRSATGSIRLFDRALPVLRRAKPDLMMYTEPAGPVFRRMFDTNYSYDELWMLEQLLAWRDRARRTNQPTLLVAPQRPIGGPLTAYQARLWMESRRRSMPEGIVTIHQVDSHDSFWWLPPGAKFRREQFGVEGFRALLFMVATLDGGMMHYPTGEQGSEAFMRRVLALRTEMPEIRNGRCDYMNVKLSEDSVFGVSWESSGGVAVPLTNLGPKAVTVKVEVPGLDRSASWSVREVFGGKAVGRTAGNIAVALGPLESALLVIRKGQGKP